MLIKQRTSKTKVRPFIYKGNQEITPRLCLDCGKNFIALNKFQRICKKCKGKKITSL